VISVRHWPYFKSIDTKAGMLRYRESIAAAVTGLVRDHGFDVTFMSTCQGVAEYWFDDSKVASEIKDMLESHIQEHVTIDGAFRTPEQFIEDVQSFDMAIATRFHMAILALVAGVPTVGIAYEFKTLELYRTLGFSDWVIDLEHVNGADLCSIVDRCLNSNVGELTRLADAIDSERGRARGAGALIREAVNRQAVRIASGVSR
jgi:colanic acid/amylovoran biosynthesis protein